MAKIKRLYWKFMVSCLKDNIVTIHNLAYFAAVYYYSCCFERGRWLYGPRCLNLAGLAYVVIVYCYSLICIIFWKLAGKGDETKEEP